MNGARDVPARSSPECNQIVLTSQRGSVRTCGGPGRPALRSLGGSDLCSDEFLGKSNPLVENSRRSKPEPPDVVSCNDLKARALPWHAYPQLDCQKLRCSRSVLNCVPRCVSLRLLHAHH